MKADPAKAQAPAPKCKQCGQGENSPVHAKGWCKPPAAGGVQSPPKADGGKAKAKAKPKGAGKAKAKAKNGKAAGVLGPTGTVLVMQSVVNGTAKSACNAVNRKSGFWMKSLLS